MNNLSLSLSNLLQLGIMCCFAGIWETVSLRCGNSQLVTIVDLQWNVWLLRYHRPQCPRGQPRSIAHHQMKCVGCALSMLVALSSLLLLLLLLLVIGRSRCTYWWRRLLAVCTGQIIRWTRADLQTRVTRHLSPLQLYATLRPVHACFRNRLFCFRKQNPMFQKQNSRFRKQVWTGL